MHGSMSEQSGSWEWQTAKAESLGVDVIWWTDHDWRLSNERSMKRYDFESAFWDAPSARWKEPDDAFPGEFRFWETNGDTTGSLQSAVVDTLAFEGQRSLRLSLPGAPGGAFTGGRLTQTCSDFQNHYSLAKHPKLRFRVWPEALDPIDSRFVFEVEFSDHPDSTPVLRYVMGSMDGEGPHSIPVQFTPGTWNELVLDVTTDALGHFSTGGADTLRALDNTTAFVRIGLESRNETPAVAFFDEYRIEPDSALVPGVLVERAREMAAYYAALHPSVTGFVGSEISRFRAQPHLNAIDQVHAQGGAVSLNHLFGPQFLYENIPNETPEHRDARRTWTKRSYVNVRALGVDVLEVGYRLRGGCDLSHHLDLWDVLNANMVFVTGNGVTDSHGRGPYNLDGWGPSELGLSTINNFVTWLWAEELSEAGLVRAMKSGRAFFGDPYRWQGTLDLATADGFRMGQVILTDQAEHSLLVHATGAPPGSLVRLLQAEMRDDPPQEYLTPNWLRDEILGGPSGEGIVADTVAIDTTVPSLVRIELRRADGSEQAFSNPIHFVRAVPGAGVAAERAAARLGPLRLFRAERLRLRDAEWDGAGLVLHLELDEDVPGLGRLRVDASALGEPHAVAGASAWSYVSGVLELTGFGGLGSAVDVSWGVTGLEAERSDERELALAPARPNPSGKGVALEYVLPRSGWVRLTVLDAAGRRVRVLVLKAQEAGGHRAVWDGRDEQGREAAAGVFYARLEHDGDTRTAKLVRLR
jgi:hypothetical protein